MAIDWDEVVAPRCPLRDSGLYLKCGTEERDHAALSNVNVSVFPEIILLCDFLKDATMVLEERSDGIDAVFRGAALRRQSWVQKMRGSETILSRGQVAGRDPLLNVSSAPGRFWLVAKWVLPRCRLLSSIQRARRLAAWLMSGSREVPNFNGSPDLRKGIQWKSRFWRKHRTGLQGRQDVRGAVRGSR
jgi:hypothetical protein